MADQTRYPPDATVAVLQVLRRGVPGYTLRLSIGHGPPSAMFEGHVGDHRVLSAGLAQT